MFDIVSCSQIGVRFSTAGHSIRLEFTEEKQHLATAFLVMNIALTGSGSLCRRTLALPVEQALVDRIIVVHGRGRIVLVGLIERHKEYIQLFFRKSMQRFQTLPPMYLTILPFPSALAMRPST